MERELWTTDDEINRILEKYEWIEKMMILICFYLNNTKNLIMIIQTMIKLMKFY